MISDLVRFNDVGKISISMTSTIPLLVGFPLSFDTSALSVLDMCGLVAAVCEFVGALVGALVCGVRFCFR